MIEQSKSYCTICNSEMEYISEDALMCTNCGIAMSVGGIGLSSTSYAMNMPFLSTSGTYPFGDGPPKTPERQSIKSRVKEYVLDKLIGWADEDYW